MRKVNLFLGILIVVIACSFLGIAVVYPMYQKKEGQKTQKGEPAQEITYQKPVTIEDYSSFAAAELDDDGYLHIPDNHEVENVSSTKIKTRNVRFTIPAAWKNNVSISARQFDQPFEKGIHGKNGITKISFFDRYSVANKTKDDEGNCGRLAILYLYDNKKNADKNSIRNDDTNLIHVGSIGTKDHSYEVYLYQPQKEDIPTDAESYRHYSYFEGINWQGCILTSLSMENEETQWNYANAYIKTYWFDRFQKNGEGISSGSGVPADYTAPVKVKRIQEEVQDLGRSSSVSVNNVYTWPSTYESPWTYIDQGSAYPYEGETTVSGNEAEQSTQVQDNTETQTENPAVSSAAENPDTESDEDHTNEAPGNTNEVPGTSSESTEPEDTEPEEEDNTIELEQGAVG